MDTTQAEQLLVHFAERMRVQLVGDSQIPFYHQLARVLRKYIQEDLQTGDRFPSEEAIGTCFGVSRPTVNRAIQELLAQGWLNRIRGRGTFVNEDPRVQLALLSDTLSPVEQFSPQRLRYELIERKVMKPTLLHVSQLLELESDASLLFLRRLRLVDEHPLFVCDSILSAERFPGLGEQPFVKGSLYATLDEVYGCPILRSERGVEADEVVDREVANLINVPLLSPILLLTGVAFTTDDKPVEYITSYLKEGLSLRSVVLRGNLKAGREGTS